MSASRTYIAVLKTNFQQAAKSKGANEHTLRQKFLANVIYEKLKDNLYHLDGKDISVSELIRDFTEKNFPKLQYLNKKENKLKPIPEEKKEKLFEQNDKYILDNVYINDKLLSEQLNEIIKESLKKYFLQLEKRRSDELFERTEQPENYEKDLKSNENARGRMRKYACCSVEEHNFWMELANQYGKIDFENRQEWFSKKLSELDEIGNRSEKGKITKYNDKKQRLLDMSKADNLDYFSNQSWNVNIQDVEILFKIPNQWKIRSNPQELREFMKGIQQKHFSDFDLLYAVVHCDEKPENPHGHLKISGKNNKTGKYDINNCIYKMVKEEKPELYKSLVPSGTIIENQLTEEQRVKLWEEFQTVIMKKFEDNLNEKHNLNKKVVFEKRPKSDPEIIKETCETKDRIFNGYEELLLEVENKTKQRDELDTEINNELNKFNSVLKTILKHKKAIEKSFNAIFKKVRKYIFHNEDFNCSLELMDINGEKDLALAEIKNSKFQANITNDFVNLLEESVKSRVEEISEILDDYDNEELELQKISDIHQQSNDILEDIQAVAFENKEVKEQDFEDIFEDNQIDISDLETPKNKKTTRPSI